MQHTLFFVGDVETVEDEAVEGDHNVEEIEEKGKMLMLLVVTLCM